MITGAVLARNEESNIGECLAALRPHVEELILIDMESSDRTVELSRTLVDVVLTHPYMAAFDAARNIAFGAARHEWLWFVDADERVSPTIAGAVRALLEQRGNEFNALSIPFKTHFAGKWIEHCGWWPGYTMPRVLRKGRCRFRDELHGGVEVDGRQAHLPPSPELAIEHFSYRDISHYVEKFNRYTSVEATHLRDSGVRLSWREGIRAMTRDMWAYYERNEGRLDGMHGWILSWLAGQYRWFSHAKLLDLDPNMARAEPPASLDQVLAEMQGELSRLRRTEASAARVDKQVLLASPLWDPSGYADEGRLIATSLASTETELRLEEIPWSHRRVELSARERALLYALTRAEARPAQVAITNCIPSLVAPRGDAPVQVVRTTFETDRIPEAWLQRLDAFDEIWVMSEENALAFRQGGAAPEKLRIVPSAVDTDLFRPDGSRLELPAPVRGRFVFLSIFDWQLRKGWDVLLRAYAQTFKPDEGAALLLKVSRGHGHPLEMVRSQTDEALGSVGASLDERPDIVLWDETLGAEQLAALYRSVDAFVLSSRGEGWGKPWLEAMASGVPVIGTQGTGGDAFLRADNSVLIEAEWVEVPEEAAQEIVVFRGHRWLEPKVDSLCKALRNVRDDSELRGRIVAKALEDVRQRFAPAHLAERLGEALNDAEVRRTAPRVEKRPGAPRVQLEGEFFAGHSFSNVNEELSLAFLSRDDVDLTAHRVLGHPEAARRSASQARLADWMRTGDDSRRPDVVIRHAFPPNLGRPQQGKWVHIQPWEFGALPLAWTDRLRDADEIWAPSEYVRRIYERSGFPPEMLQVIPWGVDTETYQPEAPSLHLPGTGRGDRLHEGRPFRFLFMGGAVERKGFDIALRAFLEEFAGEIEVQLVVKDMGARSFYCVSESRKVALAHAALGALPRIVYLDRDMSPGQRASLYTACDCLVAPYRGEGFGLPILEALACGLPAIVPRGGASDDFTSEATCLYLDAHEVECDHDWRLRGVGTELAYDIANVCKVMREARGDPTRCRDMGLAASRDVRARFTWGRTVDRMTERIKALVADSAPRGAVPRPQPTLTACVLAADDGPVDDIIETLGRVRPFVQEIVLFATHSHPGMAELATEYGARAYEVACPSRRELWNRLLRRATGDWILALEAGEHLDDESFQMLWPRMIAATGDVLGFGLHLAASATASPTECRVFRNRDDILMASEAVPDPLASGQGVEELSARLGDVRSDQQERWERRVRRLHTEWETRPHDQTLRFWLAQARHLLGDCFLAECLLADYLAAGEATRAAEAERMLIDCHRRTGDPYRMRDAADAALRREPTLAQDARFLALLREPVA